MSSKQAPNARPARASSSNQSSSLKNGYLIGYNLISSGLWIAILYRVIMVAGVERQPETLYAVTGAFARWTQTAALLEVLHSVVGIVRAPFFTTVLQVASRVVLIWGIVENFPVEQNPAYSTMLLAWSATEVVRYSYFVFFLTGQVPPILAWLRYNLFFILYPIGISSEMWLVYSSIPAASKQNPLYGYGLWTILGIYVPGSYVLYTHMMAQRRRIMRGKQRARD